MHKVDDAVTYEKKYNPQIYSGGLYSSKMFVSIPWAVVFWIIVRILVILVLISFLTDVIETTLEQFIEYIYLWSMILTSFLYNTVLKKW